MRPGCLREQNKQKRKDDCKDCNCLDFTPLVVLSHRCFRRWLSIAGGQRSSTIFWPCFPF